MLSSINLWMSLPGLSILSPEFLYFEKRSLRLAAGTSSSALGCVFIAVSLAVFAPEHFCGPSMSRRWSRRGCRRTCSGPILSAARCSQPLPVLLLRKFVRSSSTLLGLMFFLFVCMIYIPNLLTGIPRIDSHGPFSSGISLLPQAHGLLPECIGAPRRRDYRKR